MIAVFILGMMITLPFLVIAEVKEIIVENTINNNFKSAKDIYIITITTVEDLQRVSQDIYTLSRQYKLGVDLDLSECQTWEDGKGFKPIGHDSMPFTGSFDGNGHKITGLYINRPDENNVGLFGVIAFGAEIKNLVVESAYIVGKENVGAIVGKNKGNVRQVFASGTVVGNRAVGTLVGQNIGTIVNSYAMGFVDGDTWVGGLVGRNEGGTINRTYYVGKVLGYVYFGGLVGTNNSGKVLYSYWDKDVSGLPISSGGTGKTTAEMVSASTYLNWDFNNVWNIDEGSNYPYLRILGEYTYPEPTIIEINTIEQISKIGVDIEFPWYGNYSLANDIYLDNENTEELSTIISPIPSFNGTFEGNGFAIVGLKINAPNADYVGLFSRLFYGGKITNLLIENCEVSGDYTVGGLVALNEGGIIEKCKVNGSIKGNYKTGGIVGWNYKGTISQCFSEGVIETTQESGGIVGVNYDLISNCHSSMSIEGLFSLGGFSGYNSGTIKYCYSIGAVIGYDSIGGFNGIQEKGKITSCYWDRETSGITTSAGGLGRTTVQMKLKDTYYDWDFSSIWYIKSEETYPVLRWTGEFPSEEGEGVIEGEGTIEGIVEGIVEGEGTAEGLTEGTFEGTEEGISEGISEGSQEGTSSEGEIEGQQEGSPEGQIEGLQEGEGEGSNQLPETKCGCFNRDNRDGSPTEFLLDFIFIGIIITIGTALRSKNK